LHCHRAGRRTTRLLGFCALVPWSFSAWSCAVEEDIPDFEEPLLEEQACNTPTNYTISDCTWQTAYDKVMYPTAAGSFTVTDASYGVGTCVGFTPGNAEVVLARDTRTAWLRCGRRLLCC
jgi:hypothetical protein